MVLYLCIGITLLIGGILFWKRNRWISLLLFSPLVLVMIAVGWVIWGFADKTHPSSLAFHTSDKHGIVTVKGTWSDNLDRYRFLSDYLVFYVKDDKPLEQVHRPQEKTMSKKDQQSIIKDLKEELPISSPPSGTPQIVDIKTAKHFSFSFKLPKGVEKEDIQVYYIHARSEPMDALTYWAKKIPLN